MRIVIDANLRLQYIQKAFKTLQQHKASQQSVRIISKILEDIPTHRVSDYKTKYEVATELIENYQIIELVITDLQKHSEIVN